MKFLIILFATAVVRGHRHARYYESEFRTPQNQARYGPGYNVEHNRHYRDSFRQSPQPYLEEPSYREQPPPYRDDKYFGELGSFSDHGPYYPERQPFLKRPPDSFQHHETSLPFGNQQEINYNAFPPQPLNDISTALPTQLHTDQPRQSLSFGGHSNYLKFGNHALGFASVPMKSSLNNEIPSFSAVTMTFNTSAPVAHAADQTNASKVLQSWKMAQPMTETIMTSAHDNKDKLKSTEIAETDKQPMMTGFKPSPMQNAMPPMVFMQPEMKRLPFGISLENLVRNAYLRGGADARYNNLADESKGYHAFNLQQPPELLSYMQPPQIGSSVKFGLPISSLSASDSSPFGAIKFLPSNIPKLSVINHETIHPQTSLSLASAFPVSEFGQNTVHLGQIGQLDGQRQDVLQGLQLDLDGFGGIGGINYAAQASNSIAKPGVLGFAKLGLSLPDASRSIIPTFF